MPSPFPGMDPYIEKRALWPDFHASLISYVREDLQVQIRPKYNARIEERVHLIKPPYDYYPDVSIIRSPKYPHGMAPAGSALVADEPTRVKFLETDFREPYIEIVYLPTGDVVTTIEVLSPINKIGEGRDRYVAKQEEMLKTTTSLVEIDLLRGGKYTVSAHKGEVDKLYGHHWRYIVSVHRAGRFGEYETYPFPLESRLPRCRIPLREPDPDAVLDLPAVFARTYDISGYDDFIDYRENPPPPPLNDEELAWIDTLLRENGLRDS